MEDLKSWMPKQDQLLKVDLNSKLLILSTVKGFLSGKESRKNKIGGKLICVIE